MKVRELIEKLKKIDSDAVICIENATAKARVLKAGSEVEDIEIQTRKGYVDTQGVYRFGDIINLKAK